jgi:hypothetical protein
MRTFSRFALLAVIFALVVGCSKPLPKQVTVPNYDPDSIATALLQQYDTNRDGSIDRSEVEKCPALKSAFAAIDTDKDQKLSRAELVARVTAYRDAGKAALVLANVNVSVKGQPVADHIVTLTPDPAFGSSFMPAEGKTDANGYSPIRVTGYEALGVPAGLYSITVKDGAGNVLGKIPLGREIFESGRSSGGAIELQF